MLARSATRRVRLIHARRARHGRGVGEARGGEPDRLLQGPHGARDDRGRRALRPAQPGQPVVEYTGGSTGSSLAFVCAVKGYPLHIVTSDAFADEKLRTMEAFGAHVEVVPSPEGITPQLIPRMRTRAARARGRDRRLPDRPVHATPTWSTATGGSATELARAAARPDRRVCLYVGTAGCFLGVSRALRRRHPAYSASPWSRPSRRCCRAAAPARTASRAAASASGPTYSAPTTSTR